ncbi:MAG: permease [Firmicutes bacterium]|jgi:uncharacterized membrane protein YraQ (UPF0718 family)|nr:permease [Bacillota bacterium]
MIDSSIFPTIFLSIFLEAIPFILMGIVISAVIGTFVSEETIARIIPKNRLLGIVVAIMLGFFIPSCDCTVIPVARRLIKKGVPLYIAIVFMLVSPIVNPIVLGATTYAFYNTNPSMVIFRTIGGIFVAIVAGIIASFLVDGKSVLKEDIYTISSCSCGCTSNHNRKGIKNLLIHIKDEFFGIGSYLIAGILIASLVQTFVPKDFFISMSSRSGYSIIVMMLFAYLISLCSTADSFVAKVFVNQMTEGSILGFLILGPMIDIKNTLVLLAGFKQKFVIYLLVIILFLVFCVSMFVDSIGYGGYIWG